MDLLALTKEQLIEKVESLQRKNQKLESILSLENSNYNRPTRSEIDTNIEFIGDFDIVDAEGVNISEDGISFKRKNGLPIEMQFNIDGISQHKKAQLIWVNKINEGGFRYGLRFIEDESDDKF